LINSIKRNQQKLSKNSVFKKKKDYEKYAIELKNTEKLSEKNEEIKIRLITHYKLANFHN